MPLCPQITNTPITVTYNSTDYTLDSVQDVQTTATTFYTAPTPTAQAVGDVWYDTSNGNKQYRWDGSTWTLVQDTAIPAATTAAASAQSTATSAQSTATTALANASTAYNAAIASLQPSASTIVNASNQITAIASNGITVYSGSSATTGARVVLNSVGLAGYNSSNTATFAIDSSTGSATFSGSVTGSTITGGTLNIGGNAVIDASGYLTATGATITGTIHTTSGDIGGFTIGSTGITAPSYSWSLSSNGTLTGGNSNYLYYGYGNFGGGTNSNNSRLYVTGTSEFIGDTKTTGYIYNAGHPTTSSSANAYLNSSTGLLARSTSSLRYKVDVQPQVIPLESILALEAKSFFDKGQVEEKGNTDGLPRILGLIAEEVAEIPVLADLLMNKNEEGQPDSVNYDRIAVALIPLLKDLNARLLKLEGK